MAFTQDGEDGMDGDGGGGEDGHAYGGRDIEACSSWDQNGAGRQLQHPL